MTQIPKSRIVYLYETPKLSEYFGSLIFLIANHANEREIFYGLVCQDDLFPFEFFRVSEVDQ